MCDEQKPRCGQCRKGARVCDWSKGPATFLNRSTADYELSRRRSNLRFRNRFVDDFEWMSQHDGELVATSEPTCSVFRICKSRKMLPNQGITTARSPKPEGIFAPLPPLRFQSWSHDEILAEFLDNCLPLGATQEVPLSWLRSLVSMEKEIDALPLAMSALAIGWAGHADGEPQLIDKGLQLYNAAVRQLRVDIQGHSPLQVLATTVIFTVYELFEFGSESSHGWLCHVSGIAATLRILGPEMVANEPYLQIYSFVRMVFTIEGLRRRQAACAAAPMWRTIPYARSAKNQFHKFLDLSLQATELVEEADSVRMSANPGAFDRARETLCHLIEHIRLLNKWEEEAQISLINGPPETLGGTVVSPPQAVDRTTLRGYPSKIPKGAPVTFDSVQDARLMHLYWSVLLILYMTILDNAALLSELAALQKTLQLDSTNNGHPAQMMTIHQIEREANRLADNITLYSEFCCQNLWQSFGPMVSIFSLETAIRWYRSYGRNREESLAPNRYLEHCQALLEAVRMRSDERQAFDDYQNATFGAIDVLRLPWCRPVATT
ncbi:hypothetical protein DL767_003682 [Monosporascus sp. MG133]|nr:hypothetical protein DL767_003682 [Monosporascus sp. MG133]